MEWITIIFASLLTAISPTGVILDRLAENNLRSQVADVEELDVRIDNTPSYQVLEGKVDRIRIASRGVEPLDNVRIAVVELESDLIDVDIQRLQTEGQNALTRALRQPLKGAVRLVITENDINKALQAPNVKSRLEEVFNDFVARLSESGSPAYQIKQARLDFQADNRLGFDIQLQQRSQGEKAQPETVEIRLEAKLDLVAGRSLQLSEPSGSVNGRRLSKRLLRGLAKTFSKQLDLRQLEKQGITARLLQFSLAREELNLAAFVRVEPAKEQ
jgi:hypothetical protein